MQIKIKLSTVFVIPFYLKDLFLTRLNTKILSLLFITLFFCLPASYTQTAISDKSNQEADLSAVLDLISDDKGLLLTRLTEFQKNNISDPAESLIIFNIDSRCIEIWLDEWHELWCYDGPVYDPCDGYEDGEGGFEIDYQGYTYKLVEIRDQCWFAENLRATTYNDGTDIPNVTDDNDWEELESDAYCWFDNDESNAEIYGGLYNWYAVNTGKLCPPGWKVPSDEDWKILEGVVDTKYSIYDSEWDNYSWRGYDVGLRLRAASGWEDGGNGTDAYGFSALPGGYRTSNGGRFLSKVTSGYWWSSTEYDEEEGWRRYIIYSRDTVRRNTLSKVRGYSIRCIRDI